MRTVVIVNSSLEAAVLRQALRYSGRLNVAGFVDAGSPCGEVIAGVDPALVVVEDGVSTDRIKETRAAAPDAKIVALSRDLRPGTLEEAGNAGADAVIDRQVDLSTVGILIGQIVRGTVYHTFATPEPGPLEGAATELTARELEILRCVASGATNGQIARRLWVTEQTVKFHLSNTYRKLRVANRTEASHYAYTHGLLRPEPAKDQDRFDLSTTTAAA
jgi:DNA-binding NarL/FixJ family response regulator